MANFTYGTRAVCPFYIKEARKSITCEGLTEGTTTMTRFASEQEKADFQAGNCEMHNYDRFCPLAAALLLKYKEEPTP